MVCANATGCHKIPVLGIGKSKRPRGFPKEPGQLPTFYTHSAKAWMTTTIFVEWYDTIFIPQVKAYQASQDRSGERVILILDNAPTHPKASTLEREDGQFIVIFLPPNVTSVQQPMDQNVIANLKARYRKHLLRNLVQRDPMHVEVYLKEFKLLDALDLIDRSWEEVTKKTLSAAWRQLLDDEAVEWVVEEGPQNDLAEGDQQIEIFVDEANKEMKEWLNIDNDDPGFEVLDDDELAKMHFNVMMEDEDLDATDEEVEFDDPVTVDEPGAVDEEGVVVFNDIIEVVEEEDGPEIDLKMGGLTHKEAAELGAKFLSYMENNPLYTGHNKNAMKKLVAIAKKCAELKQTVIPDYYPYLSLI